MLRKLKSFCGKFYPLAPKYRGEGIEKGLRCFYISSVNNVLPNLVKIITLKQST